MLPLIMQTPVNNRNVISGGFYESIRIILLVTRWIGLLPIRGLKQCSGELTSYEWKSLYTFIYYVPSLMLQALGLFVNLNQYINSNYASRNLGNCVHGMVNFVAALCLFQFCRKWKTVLKEVESIEKLLPTANSRKSVIIGNWLMGSVLLFGFTEHVLNMLHATKLTLSCFILPDDSGLYLKSYIFFMYGGLYDYVQFSYITGVLLQISRSQVAIQWNLTDAFILVVSWYLLNLFKHFNHIVEHKGYNFYSGNTKPSWAELQVYYTRITQLVTIIDDAINSLVFISFTGNLFSTGLYLSFCMDLLTRKYHVDITACLIEYSDSWESHVYITYSILLTIARLMLVSFLAAEVHAMSRKPLYALYAVPSSSYNKDLSRLMKQVYHSRVCLTGLHFFYVTRSMILGMVGMLITYELVLLQF